MKVPTPIPNIIYGTAWKEDRTRELTAMAVRAGFRAIDTANQRRHYFEAGVGEAIAEMYRDGIVTREDLFLQTKYTFRPGQDHRLPYDPAAKLAQQVQQSLASSLEHLGTDYVDSFVLHGPSSGYGWTDADAEVWRAMVKEHDAGRAHRLGVSNVSVRHLQQLMEAHAEKPAFVQNRCFARLGWDAEMRALCREHNIVYQGFSLLTANEEVVHGATVQRIASRASATPAQIVFSFARRIGILPLTGTSNKLHMEQDLAASHMGLSDEDVIAIGRNR